MVVKNAFHLFCFSFFSSYKISMLFINWRFVKALLHLSVPLFFSKWWTTKKKNKKSVEYVWENYSQCNEFMFFVRFSFWFYILSWPLRGPAIDFIGWVGCDIIPPSIFFIFRYVNRLDVFVTNMVVKVVNDF